MKKVLLLNSFGICTIYQIVKDIDSVVEMLECSKNFKIDDFISLISDLKEVQKIELLKDMEVEITSEELKDEYEVLFQIEFK